MLLHTQPFSVQLGGRPILHQVQLELDGGTFLAILGANGQGKSTLLHALSGGQSEVQSQIAIHNKPLNQWSPIVLAQQRAVLTQNITFSTSMSCQDAVMLGRYPFYQQKAYPNEQDQQIVDEILDQLELRTLAHRALHTCSGGQQQLVQVARVLAQVWESTPEHPKLLFLDEPTSNLDIRYQHLVLGKLKAWLPQKGWGIVTVLHDLNLAAQYATDVLLLKAGCIYSQGKPMETLTPACIQSVYGVAAHCQLIPHTQQIHCIIQPSFPTPHPFISNNSIIMTTLQQQIQTYKEQHPKARSYTIAQDLGISELEVLEVSKDKTLTYLGNNYQDLLTQLAPLGKVMALTRNEHAVSEIRGIYDNVSFMGKAPMGIAHNDLIDLRYFTTHWAHVYAVEWSAGKRNIHCFQIFDAFGHAVHKIYATPATDLDVYHDLVQRLAQPEGRQGALEAAPVPTPVVPNLTEAEIADFQAAWLGMEDTHDFFGLLRKYGLNNDRQRAFELAPKGHAYRVTKNALVALLENAVDQQIPMMFFLGNRSCLQIFSGNIHRLKPMENWYNILDRDFNLHLKLDAIVDAWVVKKCTKDGLVTSIELFDDAGQHILYCFGKRKPGIPELETWRAAIDRLTPLNSSVS